MDSLPNERRFSASYDPEDWLHHVAHALGTNLAAWQTRGLSRFNGIAVHATHWMIDAIVAAGAAMYTLSAWESLDDDGRPCLLIQVMASGLVQPLSPQECEDLEGQIMPGNHFRCEFIFLADKRAVTVRITAV